MQEQHLRHQYLDMLGVSTWIARAPLPGAAKSADWCAQFVYDPSRESEGLDGAVSEQQNIQLKAGGVKSLAASLTNDEVSRNAKLIAEEVVSHLPTTEPASANAEPSNTDKSTTVAPRIETKHEVNRAPDVAAKQTQTITVTTGAVHTPIGASSDKAAPIMRLMFWQFEDVLVIDSLPTQSRGELTPLKYEKLLTNMLKAMHRSTQRFDPQTTPYVLNWPTLAGVSIDQGWTQAVSAVQYKLEKIFQGYSPTLVIMLGDYSPQMVMNMEDDFEQMRGVVFSLRSHTKAIASYSLTQMLNVPGCKQDVWSDLQKVL
jgi:hypothetical protein